jgi:hypothetical protein
VTREIAFVCPLSEELEDRLRVTAYLKKGEIVKFVIQYKALVKNLWRPIVRYDTYHGFAHKDIIHYWGEVVKPMINKNIHAIILAGGSGNSLR